MSVQVNRTCEFTALISTKREREMQSSIKCTVIYHHNFLFVFTVITDMKDEVGSRYQRPPLVTTLLMIYFTAVLVYFVSVLFTVTILWLQFSGGCEGHRSVERTTRGRGFLEWKQWILDVGFFYSTAAANTPTGSICEWKRLNDNWRLFYKGF